MRFADGNRTILENVLAHCHGQVWNAAALARSMDVSVMAVNRYRDLLAGTFMIRVLPPWFENLGKRLVKSPSARYRDCRSCRPMRQRSRVVQTVITRPPRRMR